MKKIIFICLSILAIATYSCKKDLKVDGPGIGTGDITITLAENLNGAVVASNSSFTISGTILAPAGVQSAKVEVFGNTYNLATNGASVPFSVTISVPENVTLGTAYGYRVTAVDFNDLMKEVSGSFTVSQGLNGVVLSPIAGISDPILSGLSGTFKMRMNYKDAPTGIKLKVKYSASNTQEVDIDLNNTNEFSLDPSAGKNSYIVQKTITIPSTITNGKYPFAFEITTPAETVEVGQMVEIKQISTLYVLGDATTAGWDINNPIALNNIAPNQFSKTLPLEGSPKGFKFVLTQGSWATNWGTSESNPINLDQEYDLVPNSNNIMITTTGNYVLNIDFTTNKFKVTQFLAPDSLYLVGGSCPPVGWDPNLAIPFTKTAPGQFTIFAPLTVANFGFKFLPNKGTWNNNWGQKQSAPAGQIAQGSNDNCTVAADGFYKIDVDFNTLTYTATKTDWGVIGSGVPTTGWNSDTNMTYVGGAEPYTWEIQNLTLIAGEIKFRANDDWTINMGGSGTGNGLSFSGTNLPVTAGTFKVRMTLAPNNWTYEVVTKKKK